MKVVNIEYAEVSPAVLETEVTKAVPNAYVRYRDIDEDFFEFHIGAWNGKMTPKELCKIEEVLAQYV